MAWPNNPVLTANLTGKTVMVVGANTGLGLEAAKHFARMKPARLIVTARDAKKCSLTATAITEETGFTAVDAWSLELSQFSSVVDFATRFETDGGRLDIVVINAAVAMTSFAHTSDGWETDVQVNHLSNTLLSFLLLPHLSRTAALSSSPPRLVIVSSGVHAMTDLRSSRFPGGNVLAGLNFEPQQMDDEFMEAHYRDSKLLNVLFTRALASHLQPTPRIVVTTVDPGFCLTDLRRNFDDQGQWDFLKSQARTSEEGSRQLVWAALATEDNNVEKFQGAYITNASIQPPSDWVLSMEGEAVQEKLWRETIDAVANASPQVLSILKEFTT